jgi:NADH-quinone oxidoreductase subunit J
MNITFLDLVFYKLALGIISATAVVIFSKNAVYAALSLLMVFISTAFLFMMIEAEFLGFLFLIVYGGSSFLLMIFGLFMIAPSPMPLERLSWVYKGTCVGIAGLMVAELIFLLAIKVQPFVWHSPLFQPTGEPERMKRLGTLLYSNYAVAVPIVGLILLTAIIAVTTLIGKQKSKAVRLSFRDQMSAPSEVELHGKGRGLEDDKNP